MVITLAPKPTFDDGVRKQIIEQLKTLIERAEAGDLTCFVAAYEVNGGEMYEHCWSGAADTARRIGMLRMAEHRILMQLHEGES